MATDIAGQIAQHQRIGCATVVRRQHDPMARVQRPPQPLLVAQFVIHHPLAPAEVAAVEIEELDERRPPVTTMRRDKPIRLLDDDLLHQTSVAGV
jgi:hypothetical protein